MEGYFWMKFMKYLGFNFLFYLDSLNNEIMSKISCFTVKSSGRQCSLVCYVFTRRRHNCSKQSACNRRTRVNGYGTGQAPALIWHCRLKCSHKKLELAAAIISVLEVTHFQEKYKFSHPISVNWPDWMKKPSGNTQRTTDNCLVIMKWNKPRWNWYAVGSSGV